MKTGIVEFSENFCKFLNQTIANWYGQELLSVPSELADGGFDQVLLRNNQIEQFSSNMIDAENVIELNLAENQLTVFLDPQRKKWLSLEKLNLR